MRGITADGGADSQGWIFEETLTRAHLSVEILAEGVIDASQ